MSFLFYDFFAAMLALLFLPTSSTEQMRKKLKLSYQMNEMTLTTAKRRRKLLRRRRWQSWYSAEVMTKKSIFGNYYQILVHSLNLIFILALEWMKKTIIFHWPRWFLLTHKILNGIFFLSWNVTFKREILKYIHTACIHLSNETRL